MKANEQIAIWNARWLFMGGVVACRECSRPQYLEDSHHALKHETGCKHAGGGAAYPWAELHDILDEARG